MRVPKTCPMGRIPDLLAALPLAQAERIAVQAPINVFGEYSIKEFRSHEVMRRAVIKSDTGGLDSRPWKPITNWRTK